MTAWSWERSSPKGAAGSPVDHALACLLGLLGLRVSEACRINIEDLAIERGHRTRDRAGQGIQAGPHPPTTSCRPSGRHGGG
ncbi:MAG: hypothetical protein M3083_21800, partial [Actinomycetota bacterium]|nr:hypothetical protein [Actinomycetota bacterium]